MLSHREDLRATIDHNELSTLPSEIEVIQVVRNGIERTKGLLHPSPVSEHRLTRPDNSLHPRFVSSNSLHASYISSPNMTHDQSTLLACTHESQFQDRKVARRHPSHLRQLMIAVILS